MDTATSGNVTWILGAQVLATLVAIVWSFGLTPVLYTAAFDSSAYARYYRVHRSGTRADTIKFARASGQSEGTILRRVFLHSLALASLVGLLVAIQARILGP